MSKVMDTSDLVGDQDLLNNSSSAKSAKKAEAKKHGADELLTNMKGEHNYCYQARDISNRPSLSSTNRKGTCFCWAKAVMLDKDKSLP